LAWGKETRAPAANLDDAKKAHLLTSSGNPLLTERGEITARGTVEPPAQ